MEEAVLLPFEEVKLILALAWQRGRWDGSDGGPNGYRSVLATMVDARRYEHHHHDETDDDDDDDVLSALNFIEDVTDKFHTISRNSDDLNKMKDIANGVVRNKKRHASREEIFTARRVCAGMVLDAMNFVDNGL